MDINAQHIEIAETVARKVARTRSGQLAGPDELISQAMVSLWELALSFDEERGVPFNAYLWGNLQNRLIDWLRSEYGRAPYTSPDGKRKIKGDRLLINMGMGSLDLVDENGDHPFAEHPCSKPSVEDEVMGRCEITALAEALKPMSDLERESLLWPVWADGPQEAADKVGTSKNSVGTTRVRMKSVMRRKLNTRL